MSLASGTRTAAALAAPGVAASAWGPAPGTALARTPGGPGGAAETGWPSAAATAPRGDTEGDEAAAFRMRSWTPEKGPRGSPAACPFSKPYTSAQFAGTPGPGRGGFARDGFRGAL